MRAASTLVRPAGRRIFDCVLLAAFAASLCGCVTLEHLDDPDDPISAYGGTTRSWAYMESDEATAVGITARAIDFPLTLVADTVLLPITLPVQLLRDK